MLELEELNILIDFIRHDLGIKNHAINTENRDYYFLYVLVLDHQYIDRMYSFLKNFPTEICVEDQQIMENHYLYFEIKHSSEFMIFKKLRSFLKLVSNKRLVEGLTYCEPSISNYGINNFINDFNKINKKELHK